MHLKQKCHSLSYFDFGFVFMNLVVLFISLFYIFKQTYISREKKCEQKVLGWAKTIALKLIVCVCGYGSRWVCECVYGFMYGWGECTII